MNKALNLEQRGVKKMAMSFLVGSKACRPLKDNLKKRGLEAREELKASVEVEASVDIRTSFQPVSWMIFEFPL